MTDIPPLSREFPPILDGHEDFITEVKRGSSSIAPKPDRDLLARSSEGHVDVPRAMEGGLGGCFTSIWLSNERAEMNPLGYALAEMNDVFQVADRSEGRFRICRTVADIRRAWDQDAFASVFMLEGADPISASLKELRVFYELGLRVLSLCWSRRTRFAAGVLFGAEQPTDGLTDLGRQLVHECDRLGIVLDVSHINPAGFWDLVRESRNPVVATHSSVKAISPHVRNLDDDQIRAIAEKGGTIGINFANSFLRPDTARDADAPLDLILQHFDYIVNIVGDQHVSFGTDFDGTDIPDVIKDATGLPLVLRGLKRRGYSDDALERVCNGNFLRVASAIWH